MMMLLQDDINSEEEISEEKLSKLMHSGYSEVFVGMDCFHQMFKKLGNLNAKSITLIAHNGSRFDNYLLFTDFTPTKPPLKTSAGIINLKIGNPYTSESVKKNLRQKFPKAKGEIRQQLIFRCSFNHIKSSLKGMCNSFKLPKNLRKMDYDIGNITKENYLEKQSEWEPYLRLDVISLACVIAKYNKIMKDLCGQNMETNISSPSLTFKGWLKDNIPKLEINSFTHPYTRWFIRKSIKGGRVSANINYFRSDILKDVGKILKRSSGLKTNSILELMEWYNEQTCEDKKQIADELSKLSKDDILLDFDATSLYPSAMADKESEYPKGEPMLFEKSKHELKMLNLFNTQKFRPRTGVFRVKYSNPKDLFFQHVPIKEKIILRIKQGLQQHEVSRMRNGTIIDTLTSVDIQEIVRTGGKILEIYDGIIFRENYSTSPFKSYIEKLFNKRLECKKNKDDVGDALVKLLMNSLYGKTVQKDITTENHIWNKSNLASKFDESVWNYEILPDKYKCSCEYDSFEECKKCGKFEYCGKCKKCSKCQKCSECFDKKSKCKKCSDCEQKYLVTILKDLDKSSNHDSEKVSTKLMPSHLGAFILSHSKRIMNNFIKEIDGFKSPEIYYTDTDSLYIHKKNWDVLEKADLVGGNLGQGKNDYGNGGIIFGLFVAPKIKYCLVLKDDNTLEEKTTFKGFTKSVLKSRDIFKLNEGIIVEQDMPKQWKKSIENGIWIPNENDKQHKKFKNMNVLKRKPPNNKGLMYPYDCNKPFDFIIDLDEEDVKYMIFDRHEIIDEDMGVDNFEL